MRNLPEHLPLGASPVAPVIRTLALRIGRAGGLDAALAYGASRFASIGGDLLSNILSIIRSGFNAAKQFITEGIFGKEILDDTPIIPPQTFGLPARDRVIGVGDLVGTDADGNEIDRRVYSVGINEGDIIRDILGDAIADLFDRISRTDPTSAQQMVDRYFELHWIGRIY